MINSLNQLNLNVSFHHPPANRYLAAKFGSSLFPIILVIKCLLKNHVNNWALLVGWFDSLCSSH